MGRFDYDDDDDDYDIGLPRHSRSAPPQQGSASWGTGSFVISMLNGIFLFGVIFVTILLNINQNGPLPDNDPRMVLLGFSILAGIAFAFLGLILGFVGISQGRGTVFAILGILFNGLVLVSVIGLIALGLATGG